MNSHGGGNTFDTAPGSMCPVRDEASFRHFIREPNPNEQFKVFGKPASANPKATNDLLLRLSKTLLTNDIWDKPLEVGFQAWENPKIPGGYTYLAQLVAHDMVQSSKVLSALAPNVSQLRNNRTTKLDLDTLYGPGPASSPHAYTGMKKFDPRYFLRLSRMRPSKAYNAEAHPPFRDIGRGTVRDGNGFMWYQVPQGMSSRRTAKQDRQLKTHATEALLADPRNDDNATLSQLLTVFIWLHNTVLENVERIHANMGTLAGRSSEVTAEYNFVTARRIVSSAYRRIILQDLMPKILHPGVLSHYKNQQAPFVDNMDDDRMTLEFSHAGFRFGHAMVRPTYQLNPLGQPFEIGHILRTTSSREPYSMPLNEKWIIQWSRFFDLGSPDIVNWSRRIGPSFADGLEAPDGIGFPSDGAPKQLGHRDLLKGGGAGLWSVPALAKEIAAKQPELAALSLGLQNFPAASKKLSVWIGKHRGLHDSQLTDDEITALSKDPPLLYYILYEASEEAQGTHLGVLGSIIVGETLLRHLGDAGSAQTAGVPQGNAFLQKISTVSTMPDLLTTLAETSGLKKATPPFL